MRGGISGINPTNERYTVGFHRYSNKQNYNHEWLLGGFSGTMSNNSINHTEVSPVGLQRGGFSDNYKTQ
jgi:hypothetical protein